MQCWKFPRLLLLWHVSEACHTSMSAQVVFKGPHFPWTSRQPAINCHMTGWWGWHTYRISGIVCERKHLRYVDCHSVHKKMFTNLVIQLKLFNDYWCDYKKMFANAPRFAKSMNIFFHKGFLIYGTNITRSSYYYAI